MSSDDRSQRRATPALVFGIILLVLGLVGVVLYVTGVPDLLAPEGTATGALRALNGWGAALATAGGGALIAGSIVQSRARVRSDAEIEQIGRPKGPTAN